MIMNIKTVLVSCSVFIALGTMGDIAIAGSSESDIMLYSSPFRPQGIYRGVNQWGVFAIRKSTSRQFVADDNGENRYFSHSVSAQIPPNKPSAQVLYSTPERSRSEWDAIITRRNRQNGCVTKLYGTITFIGTRTAVWEGKASDGVCDVPTNYNERIEMRK